MPTKTHKDKLDKPAVKAVEKKEVVNKPVEVKSPIKLPNFESTEVKDRMVPLLVGTIIVAAFMVGYLYGKVSVYEKIGTQATGTQKNAQADTGAEPEQAVTVSKDKIKALFADKKNIVFGDANKKVLFVEFSDPSCPYCHIAAGKNPELNAEVGERFKLKENGGAYVAPVPEMKKLVEQGKAGYVWMYSPGHGNGELATQSLYCAKEQNKFWEVHDLLMANKGYTLLNETVQNDVAKIPQMVDYLKAVIKPADMQQCLESGKYADRVKSDEALSREFGVQGTPSFFINEKNYGGAYSYVDMQSEVDTALK